jgi:hypothetical protein
VQRLAVAADAPAVAELMRSSVLDLFPAYYDETQVASAAVHIAALDVALIDDGTYYLHEVGGEVVACGGWSLRNKLFNGTDAGADSRLLDPASEPARIRAMFVRGDWTRRGLGRSSIPLSGRPGQPASGRSRWWRRCPGCRCTRHSASPRSSASH